MEFMRQPDEAKKIGVKWLKWHILRDMMNGTYVPNVIRNRYAICRPDDYNAQLTPARYRN